MLRERELWTDIGETSSQGRCLKHTVTSLFLRGWEAKEKFLRVREHVQICEFAIGAGFYSEKMN